MDDRLRALGRAARAEVEAGLDVDAELAALDSRSPAGPTSPLVARTHDGPHGATVWLAATAAVALTIVGGVWLLDDDDDAIQTAEPATTLDTQTTAPAAGTQASDSTAPSTESAVATPVATPDTGTCTDIKAHDVGVGGIAGLVVEARLAGQPPAIAGCLDEIPTEFDGSPSRCWSCTDLTFADLPVRVAETETGYSFDLAASTPAGDDVTDTIETWRFDLTDDGLRFDGVTFAEPLVSRTDSLATITSYLDAIEASDWMAAAMMLDDGAQNSDERRDLRRLDLADYSYESVAAALEQWCAPGCWTERPALADLEFNGWSHDLVRFGERVGVRWYEGSLSIDGLPPRLPDEPAADTVDWRDLTAEASGIANSCVRASLICTRVIHDPDGTPISYDPVTRQLTRHSIPPVSTQLPDAYGSWPRPRHAGPDSVVYVEVDPAGTTGSTRSLIAISLSDGDAGREIARWNDVEYSSESELVATPDGLVRVDCCGLDPIRPASDAEVVVPWIDRNGTETGSIAPSIRVTVVSGDLMIARSDTVPAGTREWSFRPPGDPIWHVMPQVTPTFDGGFVAAMSTAHDVGPGITIARGWPSGDVEQVFLTDLSDVELDRSGRVLIGDGDRVWWVEPFPDRTVRPGERAQIDVDAGTVSLPDLAEISANWRMDPVAFADAVRGQLAVNEQRTITAEQLSEFEWHVTVITSNFFDDSVFADRWELMLERGDDGRFSFVSGTWANVCQPGRGHQTFRAELCV